LYIELLTRIATQLLPDWDGDDKTALESVHSLFGITPETLRRRGRDCVQFRKVAVIVLNQVVRPFTTKWHRLVREGTLDDVEQQRAFRKELSELQKAKTTGVRSAGVANRPIPGNRGICRGAMSQVTVCRIRRWT
jgi:hypothetical protein